LAAAQLTPEARLRTYDRRLQRIAAELALAAVLSR
jgi:hypothetical protein